MKIRHLQLPSGITQGIPLLIEANWSTEQAIAVVELLDDLREQIWRHYELQLHTLLREDRVQEKNVGARPMGIPTSTANRSDGRRSRDQIGDIETWAPPCNFTANAGGLDNLILTGEPALTAGMVKVARLAENWKNHPELTW